MEGFLGQLFAKASGSSGDQSHFSGKIFHPQSTHFKDVVLQNICLEAVGGSTHAGQQVLHVVVGAAVQKQVGYLTHMTVFCLLQRCTLDPQVEGAHGLTAPDLHIELPVGSALHRPTGGVAQIPAEHQSHLQLGVLLSLRDLGRIHTGKIFLGAVPDVGEGVLQDLLLDSVALGSGDLLEGIVLDIVFIILIKIITIITFSIR